MLWIAAILMIYVAGFSVVFLAHIQFLQMVTVGLALLRALVWPVYLTTGWPGGSPLPMD